MEPQLNLTKEFPDLSPGIFLDAAGIGPLPLRSRRVLEEWALRRGDPRSFYGPLLPETMRAARRAAADLIGAAPEEIALATNTSYGINAAARMLPLAPDDIVVASAGEFPANVFPWRALSDRGVRLELVPCDSNGWPDETMLIQRVADPRVKVLAVSLVQFHTGYAVDIGRLSAACRATETFLVVDAIQALGVLPFDVVDTPVDVLACGAQKWLLSPWGAGFVYVRAGLIPTLLPAYIGWLGFEGTHDFSDLIHYQGDPLPDARRYELVTLPYQDLAAMTASIGLLTEIGIGSIRDHVQSLHTPVLDWAARRGARVASPAGPRGSGMVCIAPEDLDGALGRLTAGGVTCCVREGAIRLAPHCYTTMDDMERVTALLG